MNIEEKIAIAVSYKDTLTQQIKSIEAEFTGIAQRHRQLLIAYMRADGALSALEDVKAELDKNHVEERDAE